MEEGSRRMGVGSNFQMGQGRMEEGSSWRKVVGNNFLRMEAGCSNYWMVG